jgi:hypothetical protein
MTMDVLSITPEETSGFFFPLRTNVQYFDSPEARMKLDERVKQASLLHDKLVFEGGLYTATVWKREGGGPVFDMWHPPDSLDLDILAKGDENFQATGGQPYLKFDNHVFASGEAERQFRAQFHVLLERIGAKKLPWIEVANFQLLPEVDSEIKQIARNDEKLVGSSIPEASRFLRDKISYNLNRDLAVSSAVQLPASIDELFSPLVHEKAQRNQSMGFSALEVAIPNWSTLRWEEVFELRGHPSLIEFRKKMVTVERMASEAVTQKVEQGDLKYEVSRIITDELSEELKNLWTAPTDVMRDVFIDLVTSPFSGISTLVTAIRGDAQLIAQNRSWTTAFFKLRDRAR